MASVRKRTWGDGKSAWTCDYLDGAGVRRQKSFKTRRAADAWLVQARHQVASGTHTADSTSLAVEEAADLWLQRAAAHGLEPGTIRSYRNNLRHHLLPLVGRSGSPG